MDHCERKKRKDDPRDRANFFSMITFFYTGSIFKKALKKDLEEEQLCEAVKSCNSTTCGDKIENQWNKENEKISSQTAFQLLKHRFGKQYVILGLIDLSWQLLSSTYEPDAMGNLIGYFTDNSKYSKSDAYYNGGLLLGINLFRIIYMHNYTVVLLKFGLKVRTAFSALIYRKCLKLSPTALTEVNLGNVITLVTKDVANFEENIWTINDMWVGSIQTIFVSYLVYLKLGPTSFIGLGLLFIVVPLQIYLAKLVVKWRLLVSKKTDERLQIMQETLSAIKIIKLYTWEKIFNDKVTEARRKELSKMVKTIYIRLIVILIGLLSSKVAFYVLIMAYLWFGHTTNAELVFYILTCFNNLRRILAFDIPYGLARGAELYASLIRISKIFNAEELENYEPYEETEKPNVDLEKVSVCIKDKTILENINLNLRNGLHLVSGIVGSGKSSLLKTMLKDYPLTSGHLDVRGSISYASQDPWLFPSSIKQNILFGEPYNDTRYKEVVRICALKYDFDLLDHGDETIVADKGINLSKGQQARINLARAIYKESNIYLLDDSLTALDTHVQDYIFSNCIKEFLKDKLCILVTQCIHHLKDADNVIILNEGRVSAIGKPSEISFENMTFPNSQKERKKTSKKNSKNYDAHETEDDEVNETEEIVRRKVYHEIKKEGGVKLDIYLKYFKFGGGFIIFSCIMVLFIVSQVIESYSNTLLTDWVDLNEKTLNLSNQINSTEYQKSLDETNFTINLYSGMVLLSLALDLTKYFWLLDYCRTASLNIHKAMSSSIINAIMSFFDNHFIGNILNRFSNDLNNIDEQLCMILPEVFRVLFEIGGVLVVIATVNVMYVLPAAIFLLISYVMRQLYMPTGRSLKRLEGATRSPIVGHLNSSFEGLTTIRAYRAQNILREEFDRHQDLYTSAHFMFLTTTTAFGFFVDFCCTILISFIIVRFLFFDTETSAGTVGLVLTQIFSLSDEVQWGIRQWADLENQMTSVERVLEYTEIKPETKEGDVISDWPKQGSVKFEKVSLTYSTKEQVLKNINFSVESKQKIGIVGRTGAGKSSILSALFRLYDTEGKIMIDSVDTKSLNLDFLRQSIAIIPQDPVLFRGTMRSNIDPLGIYNDKEIWQVLEKVNIKDTIPSLDLEINETGSNFSSGQRQLICLARAIIRKNKIVVLDEATANMDPKTDALLHRTIDENFRNCTVFIIAHRLHSIINSDKILVLDKGEVIEFDTPAKLMENQNGHFYKMVFGTN